jgi:NAD(P)-dependent dehydrogenase (short-subunit alcohol dehydrogenase family)
MNRLAGKRALVTGASSGIGAGIAAAFATEGARVAVAGRDRKRAEAVCEGIREHGGRAFALIADIAAPSEAERLVAEAAEALEGLDTVVNNAGVSEVDGWLRVHEQPLSGWDLTLATNLTAPFVIARAVLPQMVASGGGAMLHISSVCAITVWAGNAAYGISKAGLNALSNHIAVEYAADGIRSNTLMPGEINTPMSAKAIQLAVEAGTFDAEELRRKHPVGRFGEIEEVAAAAVFLCSDEAPFLTGANVSIDGGYSRV